MDNSEPQSGADRGESFLFRVEDVFEITDRGCVLTPGIRHGFPILVKRGAPVVLRRPDGITVRAKIRALEMINSRATRDNTAILLEGEFKKADVPLGTEVWLGH